MCKTDTHPRRAQWLVLISLLAWPIAASADCLSGAHTEDAKSVCSVTASIEYRPADGCYAHALWQLERSEGEPVAEGQAVEIFTLQTMPSEIPGMPPLDVTYQEKVDEKGRLVFHSQWSDRPIQLELRSMVEGDLRYVGDGDELSIEADR